MTVGVAILCKHLDNTAFGVNVLGTHLARICMSRGAEKNSPLIGAVLIVIALAFSVRFSAIRFGLPILTHPDEPRIVNLACNMIQTGDLNPHFFGYPSLYIYLQAVFYAFCYGVGHLFHAYQAFSAVNVPTVYVWGQLLTVLLSTSTIFLVFLCALLLFDRTTAIISTLFISFSTLHIFNSYVITVDPPMAFMVMLSFLGSTLIYSYGPTTWVYILNGICLGFAIGTKYTAVWCGLPMLVAHVCHCLETRAKILDRDAFMGCLAAAVGFVISTPYSIVTPISFLADVYAEGKHYRTGHYGCESEFISYGFYTLALLKGYGPVGLVSAALGFMVLGIKQMRKMFFVGSFPLVYFLFTGSFRVHFERNLVVLIPFLALLTGHGLSWLFSRVALLTSGRTKLVQPLVYFLIVAVMIGSIYEQANKALIHIRKINLPDTRLHAMKWINENLPPGARIGKECYTPPIDLDRFQVDELSFHGLILKPLDKYDYVIASSGDYSRFVEHPERYPEEAGKYRMLFGAFKLVKEFVPDDITLAGPAIRVYKTPWCSK